MTHLSGPALPLPVIPQPPSRISPCLQFLASTELLSARRYWTRHAIPALLRRTSPGLNQSCRIGARLHWPSATSHNSAVHVVTFLASPAAYLLLFRATRLCTWAIALNTIPSSRSCWNFSRKNAIDSIASSKSWSRKFSFCKTFTSVL